VVIGQGSELNRLRQLAGDNVQLRGAVPWEEVKQAYQRCRAFLYPQIEDFGITAVEAQACGKPVIAYAEGGATKSVLDGDTGLFFAEQTTPSLVDAIERFERGEHNITPAACRANAERFGPERFRREIRRIILEVCPVASKSMTVDTAPSSGSQSQEAMCS
jgi:glycosyltransferase involved in cell wall biosynthesis